MDGNNESDTVSGALVRLAPGAVGAAAPHLVIDEDLIETVIRAAAPNTLRALKADYRIFATWCADQGFEPLPASDRMIVAFLRDQAAAGKKVATLTRYVSSLSRLHKLFELVDPTVSQRVRLELKACRVELGVRQQQARGLRFKGEVGDPLSSAEAGGICVAHLLEACPPTLEGLRDKALLSVAYDTGLRRAELVRIDRDHIERLASGAGRLFLPTSKTDREGTGSYCYISVRSMRALRAWLSVASLERGPVFRRLHRARTKAGDDVWTPGRNALSGQSVTLIYRAMARRAYAAGLLDDLGGDEFERWLAGVSAHSTRVGLTQDLFAAGQDLAGIMQALRWKSPTQPARYAQALAVEANAAAKVVGKL